MSQLKKIIIPIFVTIIVVFVLSLQFSFGKSKSEQSISAWSNGKKVSIKDENALISFVEKYTISVNTLLNKAISNKEINKYKKDKLYILLSYDKEKEFVTADYGAISINDIYILDGKDSFLVLSCKDNNGRDFKNVFKLDDSKLKDIYNYIKIN